ITTTTPSPMKKKRVFTAARAFCEGASGVTRENQHSYCTARGPPPQEQSATVGRVKIRRIQAYRVELPLHEGSYKWSGGKAVSVFDSTIVRVETDDGLAGHGEVCPLGPFYLPAYADGVRAGVRELAPHLLGADPRQ